MEDGMTLSKYAREEYDLRYGEMVDLLEKALGRRVRPEGDLGFLEIGQVSADCRRIIHAKRILAETLQALSTR